MPIVVRIDVELARRTMGVGEFAERLGLTPASVAVLTNGRARAVRSSTLEAMCRVLGCRPGDLLEWVDDGDRDTGEAPGVPATRGLSLIERHRIGPVHDRWSAVEGCRQ